MSLQYHIGGLRMWSQEEIELRHLFQIRATSVVRDVLLGLNKAWSFYQIEGPTLIPASEISPAYDVNDFFKTNHIAAGQALCLRPETTASSYEFSRNKPLPVCVYQAGKSYRRELNDGARASLLRFNEFWQLEFQCIYAADSFADYRGGLIPAVKREISRFVCRETRVAESDRLPAYSESTLDIEAKNKDRWIEVASCSIRNDHSESTKVCEIAIGLDRVASLAAIEEIS